MLLGEGEILDVDPPRRLVHSVVAHLVKQPDADASEAMRKRWREPLERIARAAS